MNHLIKFFTLSICLLAISCAGNKTQEEANSTEESELPKEEQIEKSLYDEVMAVHDEMMPKMESMMEIKGRLIEMSDSLREAGKATESSVYVSAVDKIEGADEAMMGWMRQFKPNMEGMSHQEKVDYLTTQKNKMDSVKVVMQVAISNGDSLLSN
ncbi:hypothetical protein [Fulvivirga lutea]|uniref:Viral A-type inclusion protein n=1 Tax=Fulvivirga lutea TaxID=2810512 RepID=A0A974WL43_9BACT|nr:hypothetical protein [Fulvivirga lutea]QSE97368.1 hypothetical protein JR347_17565 [Fulvivirga lutea]